MGRVIGYVYGLFCSCEPKHCRYIGRSVQDEQHRLVQHLGEARNSKHNTPKLAWMRKHLAMNDHELFIEILARVPIEELIEQETCFIWFYGSHGHRLTNSSIQDGTLGLHSAITRSKIGAANARRVWTPEMRSRSSASKRGKNNPRFGAVVSEETREKIRQAKAKRREERK